MQYAATAYIDLLAGRGVAITMAAVGQPEDNGFAERLMRTIREEEVDLSEYRDFANAYGQLGRFLDNVYNRRGYSSSDLTLEKSWDTSQRDPSQLGRYSNS